MGTSPLLVLLGGGLFLLVAGFLRPLAGHAMHLVAGRSQRSYDEINLHRLSWFLTLPAFALAGLGAGAGVAVSTAFGVLTVAAVAPGAGRCGSRSSRMFFFPLSTPMASAVNDGATTTSVKISATCVAISTETGTLVAITPPNVETGSHACALRCASATSPPTAMSHGTSTTRARSRKSPSATP